MNDFVLPGFDQPEPEQARQPTAKDIDDARQVRYAKYRGAMTICLKPGCTRASTYTRVRGDTIKYLCNGHKQEHWDWDYLNKLVK